MAQSSPEFLLAESKPAAQDLLGTHGQEDTSPPSDLRLETPPALQRQIPRRAGHREPAPASPPWSPIPLVLLIMSLCLLLLISARIYGAKVVELSQENENTTQCPVSCPDPNTTVTEMPQDQSLDKEKCPGRWSHSESRSYLFSPEKRPWAECKSSCHSLSASLLIIDSKVEMNFINTELFHYYEDRGSSLYYFQFWTGLSYYSEIRKWIWVDGTALSSGLIQLPEPSIDTDASDTCVYLQVGAVKLGRCEEALFCICEKMKKLVKKN